MPHLPPRFLALFALSAAGCSSNQNYDERAAEVPPEPATCVDRCRPDPGPEPVDCAKAEEGLEFATVWNFDGLNATAMYVYDDGATKFTSNGFRRPVRDDNGVPDGLTRPIPDGWEP